MNAAQLELLLQGLTDGSEEAVAAEDEPPAIVSPRTPRPNPRRVRTPENLEVVREVIEPDLVLAEPDQYQRIGQEVSRQLDYQPGKFFWHETVRPKYVRRAQRQLPPVIAPAPERVADHSLAAPGLLAQLLVGKYCDHLPFYRQKQMFWQRHGVFIARQQMVQWTAQSVRLPDDDADGALLLAFHPAVVFQEHLFLQFTLGFRKLKCVSEDDALKGDVGRPFRADSSVGVSTQGGAALALGWFTTGLTGQPGGLQEPKPAQEGLPPEPRLDKALNQADARWQNGRATRNCRADTRKITIMFEQNCPECDSQPSMFKGNGKCNVCHGTGIDSVLDATIDYMGGGEGKSCSRCGGSGVCPRCNGEGVIDE